MAGDIKFYSRRGNPKFFFLSNFFESPFDLNGREWRTVEHYFQAMKFTDVDYGEKIRLCDSPAIAKKMGRTRSRCIIANWGSFRNTVMKRALMAKFTQNPELRAKLLATGDCQLVEDSPWDEYWGNGRYGKGRNKLGGLLMEVRKDLRDQGQDGDQDGDQE